MTVDGPSLVVGTPSTYTATITGGPAQVGGFVAEATGATLDVVSPTLTRDEGGTGIYHNDAATTPFVGGTATFQFTVTATASTVKLFVGGASGIADKNQMTDQGLNLTKDLTATGGGAVTPEPTPGAADAGPSLTGSDVQGTLGCSAAAALPLPLLAFAGVLRILRRRRE